MNLTGISKGQSQALKGCALFMMVFLHLFNNNVSSLQGVFSLCEVGGVPLVNYMSRGMSPVAFYVFLSGYGLYYLHKSGRLTGGGNLKRLFRLLIMYWLSLIVFVPLGHFLRPDAYPGDAVAIIENVTAFRTTWNGETWFLFPYIMVSLSSAILFRLADGFGFCKVLAVCAAAYLGSGFLISRCWAFFDCHYAVYQIVLYLSFLLNFMLGAVFCRYADREWDGVCSRHLGRLPQWVLCLGLLLLYVSRCVVPSAAYSPLYVCLFVTIFLRIRWWGWIERVMMFLGRFSTSVWLVHTWFCYYLFRDFIYGFHYPVLIFIITMILSIAAGWMIQKAANGAYRLLRL